MRLVRIIDENGFEQTFPGFKIIKFTRLDGNSTGLSLEFPLQENYYIAHWNDDDLIEAIYGKEDDTEGDYAIIDCRPKDVKNAPEVIPNRPQSSEHDSLKELMNNARKHLFKKDDSKGTDDNETKY